ncbi:diacylglycerol kinase family protein [Candidatus Kaiserbacteria bacterium]|nr:diacylglycerol kinase family protein [Candidatus Kaiserbacteria bacterium]
MLGKKIHNVRYALHGILLAWREEFSFKLQIAAAVLASLLGWYFAVSKTEWLFITVTIGAVMCAEVFNTALEELCDKFKSEPDPHVAKIKDLAAGAVLIASAAALVVGFIIFVPKFAILFS